MYNTLLYTIYSPQIGPKLCLKSEIKKKKFSPITFLRFTIHAPYLIGGIKIMATAFLFRVPLVAKIGKRSNGHLHWDAMEAWCNNFDQI